MAFSTIYEISASYKQPGSSNCYHRCRWARNMAEAERIARIIRISSTSSRISIRKLDKSEHSEILPEWVEG